MAVLFHPAHRKFIKLLRSYADRGVIGPNYAIPPISDSGLGTNKQRKDLNKNKEINCKKNQSP